MGKKGLRGDSLGRAVLLFFSQLNFSSTYRAKQPELQKANHLMKNQNLMGSRTPGLVRRECVVTVYIVIEKWIVVSVTSVRCGSSSLVTQAQPFCFSTILFATFHLCLVSVVDFHD